MRNNTGLFLGCVLANLLSDPSIIKAQSTADDSRVTALLAQMTLDEKVGQMVQVDMHALHDPGDVQKYFLGSMLSGGGSGPAVNRPEAWLEAIDGFQTRALQTRLKIPILYGIDAVHGHNNIDGAVIFPHNIGIGAMHDPVLAREAAKTTAEEVAGTGIHWVFGPCLAVAQNIRWGRTYESYSDDPDIVTSVGTAQMIGFQTPLPNGFTMLACPKHFVADGGTQDGIDEGNTVCDEPTLRKMFLPPYRSVVASGAKSIMVSYSSWNGKKMHGNKYLLTDVLKGELGYQGFLVSDWAAIDQLSPDFKNDVEASINAGLDMIMIPYGPGQKDNYVEFIDDLKDLVATGKVPQSRIDDAVTRILRVKFQIGLFDHPFADPQLVEQIGSPEHREVARECVRESLVLLKNDHHALPLSKQIKHLTVVGAAADDLGIQCGGWTISWQGTTGAVTHGGTTLLSAIRQTVSPDTQVTFSPNGDNIHDADAIIAVVGEMPYAEMKGDRTNLSLATADAALIGKAKSAGVPLITVLYSGRPLVLGQGLDQSDAFIAAWLPGTEGKGITDVLFGDYKSTGKLSRPWPRDNSGLDSAVFANGGVQPLFPSGFGLTSDTAEKSAGTKDVVAHE
jgi:beta-glucosidase